MLKTACILLSFWMLLLFLRDLQTLPSCTSRWIILSPCLWPWIWTSQNPATRGGPLDSDLDRPVDPMPPSWSHRPSLPLETETWSSHKNQNLHASASSLRAGIGWMYWLLPWQLSCPDVGIESHDFLEWEAVVFLLQLSWLCRCNQLQEFLCAKMSWQPAGVCQRDYFP